MDLVPRVTAFDEIILLGGFCLLPLLPPSTWSWTRIIGGWHCALYIQGESSLAIPFWELSLRTSLCWAPHLPKSYFFLSETKCQLRSKRVSPQALLVIPIASSMSICVFLSLPGQRDQRRLWQYHFTVGSVSWKTVCAHFLKPLV